MMHAPVKKGGFHLRSLNLAVALISRWNYYRITPGWPTDSDERHFGSVMYFLSVFSGSWPSPNDIARFSYVYDESPAYGRSFRRHYLQVHFRYFTSVESLMKSEGAGLECRREHIKIESKISGLASNLFEERRLSVFGLISGPAGDDTMKGTPAFYSVLALGETGFRDPDKYDLKCRAGLEGTIAFQLAVLESLHIWETEWHKALGLIDKCLQVKIEDVEKWMFDDDFERSKLYFKVLHILRMFGDQISSVSGDLHILDDLFTKEKHFPMVDMKHHELQALRSNWELVKAIYLRAEKGLLDRIISKTDEINSLRDGVSPTNLVFLHNS